MFCCYFISNMNAANTFTVDKPDGTMTKPIIKVAITDDHPLVINGIEKVLTHYPYFKLTGTYDNGDALLAGLEKQPPDVLLLDIQMPGKSGEELAKIISTRYPAIRILA